MLPNLMGRKWLVNQSFQSKKNLTTSGNPYIANGCRPVQGFRVLGSTGSEFQDLGVSSNQRFSCWLLASGYWPITSNKQPVARGQRPEAQEQ
jgi:hypothetical protein